MKKGFCKIFLILSMMSFAACHKTDDSSSTSDGIGILGSSDQTDEAGQLVAEANLDLKKIKAIYKDSEESIQELQTAMGANDIEKVKSLSDALVTQINKGTALGQSAIAKIDEAENLKINDTYRHYLDLKKASLRKQLEAFEFRRQSAVLLRNGFGGKDKQEIETAKIGLKEREDRFKQFMETAREMSEEANQIAKDNVGK